MVYEDYDLTNEYAEEDFDYEPSDMWDELNYDPYAGCDVFEDCYCDEY